VISLQGLNPAVTLDLAPGWHPRIFSACLSPYWRDIKWAGHRLDIEGTNYFLLPEAAAPGGLSPHFDPRSGFFQAFVGAYVVAPVNGERVPVELLPALVLGDCVAWARRFGNAHPRTEIRGGVTERIGEDRWSAEFRSGLHCDVGPFAPQTGVPPLAIVPPVKVPGVPHWSDLLNGYDDRIDVVPGDVYYQGDYLVYRYCTGTQLTDRHGQLIDTFADHPEIRRDQERMFKSIRVLDRGTGYHGPVPLQAR
jgi:hypothetical protein